MKRGISFSEFDCYQKDKKLWYKRYVLGEQDEQSKPQLYGEIIHQEIAQPGNLIQRLDEEGFTTKEKVIARKLCNAMASKRPQINPTPADKLYREAEIEEGIIVLGFYDGLNTDPLFTLCEHKTTKSPDGSWWGWSQYKADTNAQPTFYALIELFGKRCSHRLFHEIRINRLLTTTGTVKTFVTNRSRTDIEQLKKSLIYYARTLQQEGLWTQRKSRKEIEQMQLPTP